jgi:hypothetical protein
MICDDGAIILGGWGKLLLRLVGLDKVFAAGCRRSFAAGAGRWMR